MWKKYSLGNITEVIGGGTPSRKKPEYFSGDIVWLTPSQIEKEKIVHVSNSDEKITQLALENSSVKLLPPETVLMTSRASIGYIAIANCNITTNQGFANFICDQSLFNMYLAYWLKYKKEYIKSIAKGTTFKEISKKVLRDLDIDLPGLPEQKRIVEKIEELFSKLDAGQAALERARANLSRYRQSLLSAAFSGELTRTWREEHKDELEPASELLKRIRAERRTRWAEDLRAKGKDPTKEKYSEPEPADTQDLPELPKGWEWSYLDDVLKENKESVDPKKIEETKYIGLADIDKDTGKLLSTGFSSDVRSTKSVFKKGNILYGKLRPYLNKVTIPDFDGVCSTDILVLVNEMGVDQSFIKNLLLENKFVKFASDSMSGVQHPRTNFNKISKFTLALPPYLEQKQISKKIELSLSIVDNLEKLISSSLGKTLNLKKTILEKAFSGQLVSQDPDNKSEGKNQLHDF